MQVSRYQLVWDTLKAYPEKEVKLAVVRVGHKRVKKAIIKRKDVDLAYKYAMQELNKVARLEFVSEGNVLTVILTHRTYSLWL